jgi:hypothetical protein
MALEAGETPDPALEAIASARPSPQVRTPKAAKDQSTPVEGTVKAVKKSVAKSGLRGKLTRTKAQSVTAKRVTPPSVRRKGK